MMYLPDENDDNKIYVFASKGGAPTNPDWYYNLTEAGVGSVEVGTDSYDVTVRDLTGDERDRIYAEQAKRYPGFRRVRATHGGCARDPRPRTDSGLARATRRCR
jgi:deazaflavin-dependent oxidoreductase (nitroreductase family)